MFCGRRWGDDLLIGWFSKQDLYRQDYSGNHGSPPASASYMLGLET